MKPCAGERKEFYNRFVAEGWQTLGDVPMDFLPTVSNDTKAKWLKNLLKVRNMRFPVEPRLVQRFTIGADPEFVLYDPDLDVRVDGGALQLKTGRAFGVDQNGRLIELRPVPSRWALEVLTSVLVAMRWFALTHQDSGVHNRLHWRAGAFFMRDGLGGHVHVARKKRLGRDLKLLRAEPEIRALDTVNEMLICLGVYPKDECNARRAGDQFGQLYGRPGDVRPQAHGYEYRTFPSWLDSPWMAYLTLVLSKLLVFDPTGFLLPDKAEITPKVALAKITNVLRKWAPLDDDAKLAAQALRVWGLPRHQGGDFKARWGIFYRNAKIPVPKFDFFPTALKPTIAELQEMFCHLGNQTPLESKVPEVYWQATLPEGYLSVLDRTEIQRAPGLGEFLQGLVIHKDEKLAFAPMNLEDSFLTLPQRWRDFTPKDFSSSKDKVYFDHVNEIQVSRGARRTENLKRFRDILLAGWLPIWDVATVKATSYAEWKAKVTPRTKATKTKVLFEKKRSL